MMLALSIGSQSELTINVAAPLAKNYDIVIYGGGSNAVAAALKASGVTTDQKSILMVVPERKLGSIQTVGGQNFWDIATHSGSLPQGGSFKMFYGATSQFYPTEYFASYLADEIAKHPNIEVRYYTDIKSTHVEKNTITGITTTTLGKDVIKEENINARIFIDASETGRLVSSTGLWKGTVGREDTGIDKKQMASTLMFKMKNIDISQIRKTKTDKGIGLWDGDDINTLPIFQQYRKNSATYKIKSYNAASDGPGEYWMNMLIIYDVDGTDEDAKAKARRDAMMEIEKPVFLDMIQHTKGFSKAELVYDSVGNPIVGEILYTRETIHTQNNDGTFALDKRITKGEDRQYYAHRIGLGYYWFDNNSYTKEENHPLPIAEKPWYVPYEALQSQSLSNVLIPGYAANIDSMAWTAMRVYPNLDVLGDAAGVATGLALYERFDLAGPTEEQINLLQTKLLQVGAVLEK